MERRASIWALCILLSTCTFSVASTSNVVYLERGRRGVVPFPSIPSREFTPENTDAAYWYFHGRQATDLTISFFLGSIAPQNGIPQGVYDINEDFSLVIENVNGSDEGNYYFNIQPMYEMVIDADVVTVQVVEPANVVYLARGRRGVVPFPPIPSRKFTPENTDAAYWYFPRYSPRDLLISFFMGSIAPQNGILEGVYDIKEDFSLVIENVTDSNEGNYYSKIKPIYDMVLDAGVVTVKVIDFITQTTLYLEQGVQGVVTRPASAEIELTPADIKTVHWYDTPLLDGTPSMISDFNNKIKFLGPGVPPGMYDIDEDFNLVITQVLDSSVKTYYYRLHLNGRPVQEGSVPVEILISPRTAHPVVSPCDKESSSSHCEISVPANQDTFHLTCTVENAKPAVTLEMRRLLEDIPLSTGSSQVESTISASNDNITDKESLRMINNTFTTTVSVNVEVAHGVNYFTCISSSQAHWNRRKPRTLVIIHRQELEPETATTTICKHSTTDNLPRPYNSRNKTDVIILATFLPILLVIIGLLVTICIKRQSNKEASASNHEAAGAYDSESMLDQPNHQLEYIPREHCSK